MRQPCLIPDAVAERWGDIDFERGRYPYYRPLESIRTWLASEGYLVDNFLSQEIINDAFAQMFGALKALPQDKDISIDVTSTSLDKRIAYFNATISKGEHVTQRRLKLELLPAY